MPPAATGDGEGYLARAETQQRRLLLAAAALIGPYYVAAWVAGLYPTVAMLVGLCLPLTLLAVAWRLPAASPRQAAALPYAVTVGFSSFALATAALGAGTACVGFHVVWAMPLIYAVLVPHALGAVGAGAAVSFAGGLALLVRDGHPGVHALQWACMAAGATAFALHRVALNVEARAALVEQERRQAARVASSEEHYRLVADHTHDVIWTMDLATRRFTWVSPSVERQRGYTAAEVLGEPLEHALTPASLARALAVLGRIGTPEEEDPHVGVYQQPCRDGSVKHVEVTATLARDAAGRPVGVTGTTRDVTGRVEAEQALRRSEERFRALIEKSSDIILVLDAERRIRFWSAGATQALGWTPEQVLGRAPWELELVHPDDAPAVAAASAALVHGRRGTMRIRARHRHRDGGWRLVEGVGRSFLDDPAVEGLVVNARDVTEQERLEAHLRQAQRLESIGRLAGGTAHDFNNLLTVMLSCAHSLHLDAEAGRPVDTEVLAELRDAGQRARALTRQLLAFARRQPVEAVPLDLGEVIQGAAPMLRRALGEEIALVLPPPGRWPVHGDPGQLEQVLLNLAVNARDAIRGAGRLTLRLRGEREVAGAPGRPAGDWICLEVADTGAGMPPEVLAHLFEPFFTTKPPGQGTGLGLATAYGIVTQHGGHIEVESAPGRGTTFLLRLPRWAGQERHPAAPAPAAAALGGSEVVLVVDDDDMVRAAAARVLRGAGYQVRAASGGAEALALLDGPGGPPVLALCDVIMPGMRGPEAMGRLRQRLPGVAVLYMSGHAGDALGPAELATPLTAFVPKPFMPDELLEAVRRLLDAAAARSGPARPAP